MPHIFLDLNTQSYYSLNLFFLPAWSRGFFFFASLPIYRVRVSCGLFSVSSYLFYLHAWTCQPIGFFSLLVLAIYMVGVSPGLFSIRDRYYVTSFYLLISIV
jgi:hypothetical protein